MKITIIITSLFFILTSCSNQKRKIDSNEFDKVASLSNWQISSAKNLVNNKGLLNVESILYDKANQVFYATNGIHYKVGENGFISKISKNGDLLELKWITGLNRPTGMAIHNSILYVADVNSLVLINTKTGKIIERFLEPTANSGLNDVAINKKGEIYVSASFIHSILKLNKGRLEIWLKEEEKLKWANGLIAEDKQIVVAGLDLSSINIDSKQVTRIALNSSVKDFDGIAPDGLGGYFLTTVENSSLFYFDGQNSIYKLMEDSAYFGDITFNSNLKKLYAPRGEKTTSEFFITEFKMEQRSLTKNKPH
ncbi:hypothetical protein [Aquimarina sp. 2304DJ70-9]|uniref:hypothetical protein n=1 Tax=Aquimarina penaris TaxID=3231044 RepID=UPI003462D8F6